MFHSNTNSLKLLLCNFSKGRAAWQWRGLVLFERYYSKCGRISLSDVIQRLKIGFSGVSAEEWSLKNGIFPSISVWLLRSHVVVFFLFSLLFVCVILLFWINLISVSSWRDNYAGIVFNVMSVLALVCCHGISAASKAGQHCFAILRQYPSIHKRIHRGI